MSVFDRLQFDRLQFDRLQLPVDAPGHAVYRFGLGATAGFTVAAIVAAAAPSVFRTPFAVVSCLLFGIGVVAFLSAYGRAIARSRAEAVDVLGIYGMARSCPKAVRRRFHTLTVVQSVVALATAAMRPFTAQAFGILVPMLGLGLGGLWAARHGEFPERDDPRSSARNHVKEAFSD